MARAVAPAEQPFAEYTYYILYMYIGEYASVAEGVLLSGGFYGGSREKPREYSRGDAAADADRKGEQQPGEKEPAPPALLWPASFFTYKALKTCWKRRTCIVFTYTRSPFLPISNHFFWVVSHKSTWPELYCGNEWLFVLVLSWWFSYLTYFSSVV